MKTSKLKPVLYDTSYVTLIRCRLYNKSNTTTYICEDACELDRALNSHCGCSPPVTTTLKRGQLKHNEFITLL